MFLKRPQKLFQEKLNKHFGYFYTYKKILAEKKTPFQTLKLIETEEFGRVLLIDDITQVVEKNDYLYHEVMVHPAMCSHINPKEILVIGGGDGGCNYEILKHPTVTNLTHVELEKEVIEYCKKYLPFISKKAFEHPKTNIIIDDGHHFIKNTKNTYDIIIMDMIDPLGLAKNLYTLDFFKNIKKALKDSNSIFVMHAESPITRPILFNQILQTLSTVFNYVSPFYNYIQMYSTLWTIAVCSKKVNPKTISFKTIKNQIKKKKLKSLKVFNEESFFSMQVELPYIQDIRKQKVALIKQASDISDL